MLFLSRRPQVALCLNSLVILLFGSFLCSAVALDLCPRTCGDISIPYPFGITPGCGLPAFQLNCSVTAEDSPSMQFDGTGNPGPLFPFLATGSGSFQVLQIMPASIIINITNLKAHSCDGAEAIATFVLEPLSPFFLSGNNKFFVTGCNFTGDVNTDLSFGSTSSCNVSSCFNTPPDSALCNSQQCCVALPGGSREVVMHAGGNRSDSSGCGFASIAYPPSFAITSDDITRAEQYGLELAYTVDGQSCSEGNFSSICALSATCFDVEYGHGHVCRCDGADFVGDGYQAGSGCSEDNECKESVLNRCAEDAECISTVEGVHCYCVSGYEGDGYSNGTGCVVIHKRRVTGLLAVLVTLLVLVVGTMVSLSVCWLYKRRKAKEASKVALSKLNSSSFKSLDGQTEMC